MPVGGLHNDGMAPLSQVGPNEDAFLRQNERAATQDLNARALRLEDSLAHPDVEPGADIPSGSKSRIKISPEQSGRVRDSGFGYSPEVNPSMGNDPRPIQMPATITLAELQKGQKRYPCPDCETASAIALAEARQIASDKDRKARLYAIETGRAIYKKREELQDHLLVCERRQCRINGQTVAALVQGVMPSLAALMAHTVKEALREEKKNDAPSSGSGVVSEGANQDRPKPRRKVG